MGSLSRHGRVRYQHSKTCSQLHEHAWHNASIVWPLWLHWTAGDAFVVVLSLTVKVVRLPQYASNVLRKLTTAPVFPPLPGSR